MGMRNMLKKTKLGIDEEARGLKESIQLLLAKQGESLTRKEPRDSLPRLTLSYRTKKFAVRGKSGGDHSEKPLESAKGTPGGPLLRGGQDVQVGHHLTLQQEGGCKQADQAKRKYHGAWEGGGGAVKSRSAVDSHLGCQAKKKEKSGEDV